MTTKYYIWCHPQLVCKCKFQVGLFQYLQQPDQRHEAGCINEILFGNRFESNHSEGPIPKLPSTINVLDLSKNMISGPISPPCTNRIGSLSYLDLSHNLLSGELPDCWKEWNMLNILLLPNNNFSGKIPNSTGFLGWLQALHLSNNHLTGELPSSLKNCTKLTLIDLAKNKLSEKNTCMGRRKLIRFGCFEPALQWV